MSDAEDPVVLSYFPAWYRERGVDHFLLWRPVDPSDQDGVVVNEHGNAVAFPSTAALEEFARHHDIQIGDAEVGKHDLDAIAAWLADPQPETVDCRELLNVLNLASDVSQSVEGGFSIYDYDSDLNVVYDKLFWGTNPSALTPEGEHFTPTWDDEEVAALVDAAARALTIFRNHVTLIE